MLCWQDKTSRQIGEETSFSTSRLKVIPFSVSCFTSLSGITIIFKSPICLGFCQARVQSLVHILSICTISYRFYYYIELLSVLFQFFKTCGQLCLLMKSHIFNTLEFIPLHSERILQIRKINITIHHLLWMLFPIHIFTLNFINL